MASEKSAPASTKGTASKNARREAMRESARLVREAAANRKRRRTIIAIVVVVVIVLAAVGGIVAVAVSQSSSPKTEPTSTPTSTAAASNLTSTGSTGPFPEISLAASGQPTVTIPSGVTPSTTTQVKVLKAGTGAKVKDGDTVTFQYQGVIWQTGKIFDQSWGSSPATFATTQLVPGFADGMVGQTIGSQVLVTVPPADGYGSAGNSSAGISGTDTLVFVIDILSTGAQSG